MRSQAAAWERESKTHLRCQVCPIVSLVRGLGEVGFGCGHRLRFAKRSFPDPSPSAPNSLVGDTITTVLGERLFKCIPIQPIASSLSLLPQG